MPRFLFIIAIASLSFAAPLRADDPPAAPTTELAPIVVTGAQPGPGLWKVERDGHVLWILGTLSPLPRDMDWKSDEVRHIIAEAGAVLDLPRVRVKTDLGFFGKLRLLPSLIGVRDNPHHARLESVVPPALYARWTTLKDRYIGAGRGRNLETWRPIFAAIELYRAAIDAAGLTLHDVAGDVVDDAAKKAHIEPSRPTLWIPVDDPHAALVEFREDTLDDVDCFARTLDRIEDDLDTMAARANAWATADLDALRRLPADDQRAACLAAVTESEVARNVGVADIVDRVRRTWLDAALAALTEHEVTFARVPIADLLDERILPTMLRNAGCTVTAPDAPEPVDDAPVR